jgi:outer membrane protein assembly factor BamB
MNHSTGFQLLAVAALVFLWVPSVSAADWPQWRGPNRDGMVQGVKVPEKWPKALKEGWKVTVGEGVSSPVVVGDKVFVFTRQKDDELVLCLDLTNGNSLWKSEPYRAPYQWWPGEGNFSKGPRSTPTVAGGRVYTAGVSGVISCFDAGNGKLLWRKTSKAAPPYGGPASPLVTDGLCIIHLGCDSRGDEDGLTAFDAATGEVKWRFVDGSRPGAGSPVVVELAGERQVVALTSWDLLGVSIATGKKLWAVKLDGSEKNSTPLLYKDTIIFADYKERPRAIRLEKGEKGIVPKEVWKGDGPTPYMNSPVIQGDLMFGMSARGAGCFFCLDPRTGKTLWESDQKQVFGYASTLGAGNVVLFLTPRGRLIVVKADGKEYEPIAEYTVSDHQTWPHPVFLGDRILIKDETTLRSFSIRDGPGP